MPSTKYNFKISPNATIQIEADTQSEAYKQWAAAFEVFGVTTCGLCGGEAYPRVRVVDSNAYHEMSCLDSTCGGVKAYGQHKKGGGLFPKRKDKDGKWLPNDGWVKWQGVARNDEGGDDEEVTTTKAKGR